MRIPFISTTFFQLSPFIQRGAKPLSFSSHRAHSSPTPPKKQYFVSIHDDPLNPQLFNKQFEGTPFGPSPQIEINHAHKSIDIKMWPSLKSSNGPTLQNTAIPWKSIKIWMLHPPQTSEFGGLRRGIPLSLEYVPGNYNFSPYFYHTCAGKNCGCRTLFPSYREIPWFGDDTDEEIIVFSSDDEEDEEAIIKITSDECAQTSKVDEWQPDLFGETEEEKIEVFCPFQWEGEKVAMVQLATGFGEDEYRLMKVGVACAYVRFSARHQRRKHYATTMKKKNIGGRITRTRSPQRRRAFLPE